MSVTYDDGFFPFAPLPYAEESASNPAGYGKLFGLPLATLMQIYWRAKSATVTAALAYNLNLLDVFGNTTSDVGTISGSATVNTGPFAVPPAQRVAVNGYGANPPFVLPNAFTMAGTLTNTFNPSRPPPIPPPIVNPYSQAWGADLQWFAPLVKQTAFDCVCLDQATKNYYTRLYAYFGLGTGGFENPIPCYINMYLGDSFSFPLSVRINGTDIGVTFPFFISKSNPAITVGLSGGITVDFNDFWTV